MRLPKFPYLGYGKVPGLLTFANVICLDGVIFVDALEIGQVPSLISLHIEFLYLLPHYYKKMAPTIQYPISRGSKSRHIYNSR